METTMSKNFPRTILIVENSQFQANVISQHITACSAFNTVFCSTMSEIGAYLDDNREDVFLAVLNLSLKDAPDGEAVDYVLGHNIPCIVLTSTFDDDIRNRFLEKNVLDYFNKARTEDLDNMVDLIDRIYNNKQIKVIVAEDATTARKIIMRLLRNLNFTVIEAEDGQVALDRLEENPDTMMVITDYEMPNVDGFTLVSKIRQAYPKDKLSIIGISAHSSGSLTAKFLKNGANDFLNKPFEFEEFYCRVTKNINEIEKIRAIKEVHQRDYLVANVFNRGFFIETGHRLEEKLKNGTIANLNLAVVRSDKLLEINERHGLESGDQVLVRLAAYLEQNNFDSHTTARCGDKFFLLSCQDQQSFLADLKKCQESFSESKILLNGQDLITATCSIAYTETTDFEYSFMQAERILSDNKRHRNQFLKF